MSEHLGDLLSALADDQLAGPAAHQAAAHLAACSMCAAELALTREVRALVRGLPPVDPRRPLLAVAPPLVRPRRLAGLAAAAAAVAALVMLAGVEPESRAVPQVAQLVQVHSASALNADPVSQLAPAALPVSLDR